MKQTKKILKVLAKKDLSMSIYYEGEIVRIGDTEPVEFDLELLPYESRIHLDRALNKDKTIEVVQGEK